MQDVWARLASLTPEKRARLSEVLARRGGQFNSFPLSFAQQRLWFLHRWDPGSAVYNLPAALRLTGSLDTAALGRSLREIVRRHEVFRTRFVEIDGQPLQIVSDEATLELPSVDLRDLEETDRQARVREMARLEASRPFDLERGPMLRSALLRTGEEEFVLLVTMHHIVADGWSLGVLLGELAALYQAYAAGRPSPLTELRVQYADFAAWQREWLGGSVYEEHLAWWKRALEGAARVLELPADRPRPPAQTFRGASESLLLPPALAEALGELARKEGATLFMVLAAGFSCFLSRMTGRVDLLIGTPIANRARAEIEGLVGFFVNTLPLRMDLSGEPSFRELVRRVREFALGAYAHQDMPFEKLVEELQPDRDPAHTPLIQVMLALQNAPAAAFDLPGLALAAVDVESDTAKFDLTLSMEETGDGLWAVMVYNTDLFDRSTIAGWLTHLRVLLDSASREPDTILSALPLIDDAERRRVLEQWSGICRPYPREATIHELFDRQTERRPNAAAAVFEGRSLTYGQLSDRASRLAHHLRQMGVGADVPVGLCVERSFEMLVGALGILKAGGAYVPLDPGYPRDRLVFMLADCGARVVVTDSRVGNVLPASPARIVRIADATGRGEDSERDADRPAGARSLAYLMYTSGSTGRPKGVAVEHRSVVRLVSGTSYARFGEDDVFFQFAPISFDASVFEIWGCLLNGGRLLIAPAGALSVEELGRLIREGSVTTLWLTASLFRQMVDSQLDSLRGVRQLLAGGDVLSLPHVKKAFGELKGCRIVNGYGPTEATTFTCCWDVADEGLKRAAVPIGTPIANTRVYLLDERMEPVPAAVPGELYIGGDGLARGYLGRPELTAERFVPDPFGAPGEEGGGRLYRSGDLARWLAGGTIEFLGRVDQQVKIRGFRIEPGEIESVLVEHPDVLEAAVVSHEAAGGDRRLAAFVVPAPQRPVGSGELREFLRSRLPEYMVPSSIVSVDSLPLTPVGKVDRAGLAEAVMERRAGEEGAGRPAAARTPVEEVLAGIWSAVLGVERIGPEENFFDLGGHSLLATQVISRVREAFGVEVALRRIFEQPTVGGFGRVVEEALAREDRLQAPPVRRVDRGRGEEAALSYAQERLWFLDQLEPASPFYNVPAAARLRGRLDVEALRRSVSEIVGRHEALRTSFVSVEGRPVQVIAPQAEVELRVRDLSDLEEGARGAEAARLTGEEASRPFDLSRGPLIRAGLLRLAEEDHALVVTMHHIVSDGWSLGVFIRELSALYGAFTEGRESPLAELAIQYADFAHWQRTWLGGEALGGQLAYWKERLGGAPAVLELPLDRPRQPVRSGLGGEHHFSLPAEVSEKLRRLSRREGATLFMTLLGGFAALLGRYSGSEDVVVGTPIANRTRAEIENLIGFFVNTLVLRCDLSGDPSFREFLARVRETALGAYAHQDLPFERLVEELSPERDLSHSPLFQVMFAVQNAPGGELELAGLSMEPMSAAVGVSKFDLSVSMIDTGEEIAGAIEYSVDLFDEATVARMTGHLARLYEGIVAAPESRLSALPLLSAGERRVLLEEWSGAGEKREAAGEGQPADLVELFEGQVGRSPEAVGVLFEGKTLSYRQLNERANRLAHHLIDRGVGPESRVAVCLERGFDLVVGLLGVLKAGGAWVPVEAANPPGRLRFLLEDCGAVLALGSERTVEKLRESKVEIPLVLVDAEGEDISRRPSGNPPRRARPTNLAYVIYTSGSTGEPKGVGVERASLDGYLQWVNARLVGEDAPALPAITAPTFDASLKQLLAPLLRGGAVWLVPAEAAASPPMLLEALSGHANAGLNCVPSLWRALLEAASGGAGTLPAGLRRLFLGGESVPADLIEATRAVLPDLEIWNLYGPTEATANVAASRLRDEEGVTIGRPVGGARIYILDSSLRLVPRGVAGELCVGGLPVARGYIGRPDVTAASFIPDPFGAAAGCRLYRTGDLARHTSEGCIEYLGRIDRQMKIRGLRIEPGEIESVLRRHESVHDAVVADRPAGPGSGERRIVAWIVARRGFSFDPSALRQYARSLLPDFMIPTAFVPLEAVPLTRHGKLDTRALPEPGLDATALKGRPIAPRTKEESILAAIWAETLHLPDVGVTDDFFERGGHSLLIPRLLFQVRRSFGVDLPLRALFEGPTVEGMARAIERAKGAGGSGRDETEPIDWSAETALDAGILPVSTILPPAEPPRSTLLTGATGFLGAFLLRELLDRTSLHVYCLVRARDERDGAGRIRAALERYLLWDDCMAGRITAVAGDLAGPLLGLGRARFDDLALRVDAIHHGGALVSFLYPYQLLKAANVSGTTELLRIATTGRLKPVHFVSTLSVFAGTASSHARDGAPIEIGEDQQPEPVEDASAGYAQSKWVAERLVMAARARGIPATVYRSGRITGHSETGAANPDDLACRYIRGCIEVGAMPDDEAMFDMTPVDYVAAAIAHLSMEEDAAGKNYHLLNPRPISASELASALRSFGYVLRRLPYARWRERLAARAGTDGALDPVMFLFPPEESQAAALTETRALAPSARFRSGNASAALSRGAIHCPPAGENLVHAILSYLVTTGFLEAPRRLEDRRIEIGPSGPSRREA